MIFLNLVGVVAIYTNVSRDYFPLFVAGEMVHFSKKNSEPQGAARLFRRWQELGAMVTDLGVVSLGRDGKLWRKPSGKSKKTRKNVANLRTSGKNHGKTTLLTKKYMIFVHFLPEPVFDSLLSGNKPWKDKNTRGAPG